MASHSISFWERLDLWLWLTPQKNHGLGLKAPTSSLLLQVWRLINRQSGQSMTSQDTWLVALAFLLAEGVFFELFIFPLVFLNSFLGFFLDYPKSDFMIGAMKMVFALLFPGLALPRGLSKEKKTFQFFLGVGFPLFLTLWVEHGCLALPLVRIIA